ncbi:MAG: P27 family phage terminase small subunit, partial [Oscillospiraceae bacterium]|nr:P27 family phage terminase small subunit [Oscillospiraceae bacterium]
YITAEELYRQAVKDIRSAQKQQPDSSDLKAFSDWAVMMDKLDKRQDRYFKQAHACASALGLTISSRCKLVIPKADEEEKVNRFAHFDKAATGNG